MGIGYRKICNRKACRKHFKGSKLSKYCSDSCRTLACQERKLKGDRMKILADILELELSFVPEYDLLKVVKVCIYSVKKWRKDKLA